MRSAIHPLVKKLDADTICQVLNASSRSAQVYSAAQFSLKALQKRLVTDMHHAAIRVLVSGMKHSALQHAVDSLHVVHGRNNPKSRMVLEKRLLESMTQKGPEQWLCECSDRSILESFGEALLLEEECRSIRHWREALVQQINTTGMQVILSSATLPILRQCCESAGIVGWEPVTRTSALLDTLVFQTPITNLPTKSTTKKRKPKKRPIEECDSYDQLFQHYLLSDLVEWCRQQGLRTTGKKKIVINRILAYLDGDTENTMVVDRHQLPVPSPSSSACDEDEETESEDWGHIEDMTDYPDTIEDCLVAVSASVEERERVYEILDAQGAVLHEDRMLTKEVDILIVPLSDILSSKYCQATSSLGVRVLSADTFLVHYETDV